MQIKHVKILVKKLRRKEFSPLQQKVMFHFRESR